MATDGTDWVEQLATMMAYNGGEPIGKVIAVVQAAERLCDVRHGGECGIALDDLDILAATLAQLKAAVNGI